MLAAAVGVVYRRPTGAVVTVQRVRRRLRMSRLDSTRHPFLYGRVQSSLPPDAATAMRAVATITVTTCYARLQYGCL